MTKQINNIVVAIMGISIYLVYAGGFTYMGLYGFFLKVMDNGFRRTLCGTSGCSNGEFLLNMAWLAGVILFIYVLLPWTVIYVARKWKMNKSTE